MSELKPEASVDLAIASTPPFFLTLTYVVPFALVFLMRSTLSHDDPVLIGSQYVLPPIILSASILWCSAVISLRAIYDHGSNSKSVILKVGSLALALLSIVACVLVSVQNGAGFLGALVTAIVLLGAPMALAAAWFAAVALARPLGAEEQASTFGIFVAIMYLPLGIWSLSKRVDTLVERFEESRETPEIR